jgi:hypothetical protein
MNEELITIASFASVLEAELARGYLQSHGIDVFLADENIGRIANHLYPIVGGIKLQVSRKDVDRARALLTSPEASTG